MPPAPQVEGSHLGQQQVADDEVGEAPEDVPERGGTALHPADARRGFGTGAPRSPLPARQQRQADAENQLDDVRYLVVARGFEPVVYEEVESAAKARPVLERMLADVRAGRAEAPR